MSKNIPSLKLLISFEAAARHLSFKKAAEDLCVTPAAISHQIRVLEKELNTYLFIRSNRSIELTEEGVLYFSQIKKPLFQLNQATSSILNKIEKESLIIHSIPYITSALIAPNIYLFTDQNPNLKVVIESKVERKNLNSNELMVAIRHEKGTGDDFIYDDLVDINISPICGNNYFNLHKNQYPQSDSHRLIRLTSDAASWSTWSQQWQPPFTISESLESNGLQEVITMAEQNMGLAMGFFPIVQPLVDAGKISIPFPDQVSQVGGLYLAYHKENKEHPAILSFRDWFNDILKSLNSNK